MLKFRKQTRKGGVKFFVTLLKGNEFKVFEPKQVDFTRGVSVYHLMCHRFFYRAEN